MDALVYVWSTMPREFMAREIVTGIVATGQSRDEALALFKSVWGERAPFQLIEHAPPRPKRPDDPKPAAAAIEGDTVAASFHRALVRRFHSDLVGDRRFTADQVLGIVNECWEQTRAKA